MTKVEKLEREIKQLNRDELAVLREWFRKFDSEEWDRLIERDAREGKLEVLAAKALEEHKAGRTKEI